MNRVLVIAAALAAITLGVYWQVVHHDFIDFDDPTYVTENVQVQQGLTLDGVAWAFTNTEPDNWHPVTWLSHMLDCQLYGLKPGWHHLSSVLLHVVNAVLLFLVLNGMTGALWKSAFVAALFALHPLHVESVAWISERKDVLSTLFWFLTLGAYSRYADRPNILRYAAVFSLLALGLMAKPMLVTVPFVLLLADWWPLRRLPQWSGAAAIRLVVEKIPLFILAGLSSAWTYLVQRNGQAVMAFDEFPMRARVGNALLSYVRYVVATLWPTRLAVFYPYHYPPRALVLLAAGTLLTVSAGTIWWGRRHRYLVVGWLWYLGTLVPVVGLVQVGMQSMADRYTYVPLVGLFIIVAWGIADLLPDRPSRRIALAVSGGLVVAACAGATWLQVRYWQNSITLHEHALAVTTDNYVAHHNLGAALYVDGRIQEAATHFAAAVRIKPNFAEAVNNLGVTLYRQGRLDEARSYFLEAVRIKPDYDDALNNLTLVSRSRAPIKQIP